MSKCQPLNSLITVIITLIKHIRYINIKRLCSQIIRMANRLVNTDRQHVSYETGVILGVGGIAKKYSGGYMFLQRSCRLQQRLRVGADVLKSIQHWPGRRRTGLFLPLQKRTLLKTPRKCRSQRERGSLLGLGRRLEADTRSLLDSRAWRFCRIRELAIAAISSIQMNELFDGCSC